MQIELLAFENIEKAAKYYNVNLAETSWHDLGRSSSKTQEGNPGQGVATACAGWRVQESCGFL
jgi:hypothetical protein